MEEQKLNYDSRKKELTQIKTKVVENKSDEVMDGEKVVEKSKLFSTVTHDMKAIYTEEGIRLAYNNLSKNRTASEKRIADLKKQIDAADKYSDEEKKEVEEFKKKLEMVQKIDTAEKAKADYEEIKEQLKSIEKEIRELKDIIGDRLKL